MTDRPLTELAKQQIGLASELADYISDHDLANGEFYSALDLLDDLASAGMKLMPLSKGEMLGDNFSDFWNDGVSIVSEAYFALLQETSVVE